METYREYLHNRSLCLLVVYPFLLVKAILHTTLEPSVGTTHRLIVLSLMAAMPTWRFLPEILELLLGSACPTTRLRLVRQEIIIFVLLSWHSQSTGVWDVFSSLCQSLCLYLCLSLSLSHI